MFGGFVIEYLDKVFGKYGVCVLMILKVMQFGIVFLIVYGMYEFGRYKYFIVVGKMCYFGQISGIMVGVQIIEIGLRVYYVVFL